MLWLMLKRFSEKKLGQFYLYSAFFWPKISFHLIWTQTKTKFWPHLKNCCISRNLLRKNIFCWNSICHSIDRTVFALLFFIFFSQSLLTSLLISLVPILSHLVLIWFSQDTVSYFFCLLYPELKLYIEERISFVAGIDFPHSLSTVHIVCFFVYYEKNYQ